MSKKILYKIGYEIGYKIGDKIGDKIGKSGVPFCVGAIVLGKIQKLL